MAAPSLGRGRAAALRPALLLAALLALSLGLAAALVPLRRGLDAAPGSTAVYDRKGRLLRLALAADGRYRVISPLAAYPPWFVEALLLKEDRWFHVHPGVNPFALAKAAYHSSVARDYRAGASTLTMQLARLVGGYDTGGLSGKLRQILDALGLELACTKREILGAYLSRAPCGGNIEGFEAASLAYFALPLASLPRPEAFLLLSLPQRPSAVSEPGGMERLLAARSRLLADWETRRGRPEDALGDFDLPVRLAPKYPFEAPHAVDALLAEAGPRPPPRLDAAIDLDLQRVVERVLGSFVSRRGGEGIRNAAALLADARSLEILAEVGSADFFDAGISGQVNGCLARRSPGSALKPFLYALAMDGGLIHPATVLVDSPLQLSGYTPDNFDRDFAGPISAAEALVRSRNVPAVWLAKRLRTPDFRDFLGQAGIGELKPREWYGASLPLGTAEVTMRELASLYAMLARSGALAPLRPRLDSAPGEPRRLLSPEASWIVLDILGRKPRPESAERAFPDSRAPACAWKTGTSIGFRDAWAVGVAGSRVLAVWVGNFDGSGNPAFVGMSSAGPLLFEILEALAAEGLELGESAPRPAGLARAAVCAVSGKMPTELCPRTEETWFIPGVSPIGRCDVHQELFVDLATGLRRRGPLGAATRREVVEVWPSDVMAIFAKAGLPRRQPPPFAPGEEAGGAAEAAAPPQIVSPLAKGEYVVRADGSGEEMPLVCVIASDATRVFWFLDGSFLGVSARGENLYWKPRPGAYSLRATDDLGRSSSCRFRVVLEGSTGS